MNKQSRELLKTLTAFRAQSEPRVLQAQAARIWEQRWLTLLGVSIQDALAATLVNEGVLLSSCSICPEPLSVDVWLDGLRSYDTMPTTREGNNGRVAMDGIVANGETIDGTAINGIAESLEGRGPANDGIAMDGINVGPALDELESSPSGGPVERDCRNPYPGSGRLNTLASD